MHELNTSYRLSGVDLGQFQHQYTDQIRATIFNHGCLKKMTIFALKCFFSIILPHTVNTAIFILRCKQKNSCV